MKEIVIKVDEKDFDLVRKYFKPTGYSFIPLRIQTEFISAIINGTPLPKEHGRLIDADTLWRKWVFDTIGKQEIDDAPTIIEANRGEEQK